MEQKRNLEVTTPCIAWPANLFQRAGRLRVCSVHSRQSLRPVPHGVRDIFAKTDFLDARDQKGDPPFFHKCLPAENVAVASV